jgi:hypothetical protein
MKMAISFLAVTRILCLSLSLVISLYCKMVLVSSFEPFPIAIKLLARQSECTIPRVREKSSVLELRERRFCENCDDISVDLR